MCSHNMYTTKLLECSEQNSQKVAAFFHGQYEGRTHDLGVISTTL